LLLRPVYYRKSTKDELETIHEVFDQLVYKSSWFTYKTNQIKTVVDIGALIGAFTLWAHEQWPKAKIYAYEPDPDSFKILEKNIKRAKLQKKVKAFMIAVWGKQKSLKFHRFTDTPGSNSVVYIKRPFSGKKQETINVQAVGISKIISDLGKIDFLKIDCEGGEYNILYSLPRSKLTKIRNIVLEYHEFSKKSKQNGLALSNFLRKSGYATQILPMDVRKNMGLGYIFAENNGKLNQILNKIFDADRNLLTKIQKLSAQREKYAKELEKTVKGKTAQNVELEKLATEREKYAKELESATKEKTNLVNKLEKT